MNRLISLLLVLFLATSCQKGEKLNTKHSGKPEMDRFIDGIMKKMTLEEKLGQLNLPASGDITTGQAQSSGIAQKIREGKVGGLFNIREVQKIREVQRIAME